MANAIYPLCKQHMLDAVLGSATAAAGTIKAALLDTGTVAYNAAHDFYDDISAGVVGTPQEITSPTFTNGTFDGANVTYTGLTGNSVEAVVIYLDTGTPSTSRLISYQDTGITGLPLTPSGADVTLTWDAAGIFTL